MPTDTQRRNLTTFHNTEIQRLLDRVKELEKQLETAFSAINYWKEETQNYKIMYKNAKIT